MSDRETWEEAARQYAEASREAGPDGFSDRRATERQWRLTANACRARARMEDREALETALAVAGAHRRAVADAVIAYLTSGDQ